MTAQAQRLIIRWRDDGLKPRKIRNPSFVPRRIHLNLMVLGTRQVDMPEDKVAGVGKRDAQCREACELHPSSKASRARCRLCGTKRKTLQRCRVCSLDESSHVHLRVMGTAHCISARRAFCHLMEASRSGPSSPTPTATIGWLVGEL